MELTFEKVKFHQLTLIYHQRFSIFAYLRSNAGWFKVNKTRVFLESFDIDVLQILQWKSNKQRVEKEHEISASVLTSATFLHIKVPMPFLWHSTTSIDRNLIICLKLLSTRTLLFRNSTFFDFARGAQTHLPNSLWLAYYRYRVAAQIVSPKVASYICNVIFCFRLSDTCFLLCVEKQNLSRQK